MDASPLLGLTRDALETLSPQTSHSDLVLWLVGVGQAPLGGHLATAWLERAHSTARVELLCALAQAHHAQGLAGGDLLAAATALCEAAWTEPERGWRALGAARLALGDRQGAHGAWTHPDSPYSFVGREGLTRLAQAHRQAGDWVRLEALLRYVGPGHDQARMLGSVVEDALARAALGDALSALWWVPEPLREGTLLHTVWGLARAGRQPEGWAIEAQWDGLEGTRTSRALARILLGDAAGARALLPSLRHRRGLPMPMPQGAPEAEVICLGLVCLALGDLDGATESLQHLPGTRARLRALRLAARLLPETPPWALAEWVAAQAASPEDHIAVAQVLGPLEIASGRAEVGQARLQHAVERALRVDDFYTRRLALQSLASAQIQQGAVTAGLETIDHLPPRLREEHQVAAGVQLARAGSPAAAAALLQRLPLARRGVAGVAVLCALAQEPEGLALAWDIHLT